MKNVFTIAPDVDFLDALASELWRRADGEAGRLADSLILLPTRRSCRALREAFLKIIQGPAALLPRMQPLGEIDEDEFYFAADPALDVTFLPAITPLRRQLLLTQLIAQKDKSLPLDQAAQLAVALAQFLDQVQIEDCDLAKLKNLVQDRELAEHWQQTVAFLGILTQAWPQVLKAEGCIDPADRRNRIMRTQAEIWRKNPPAFPVIAAGSTGTMPATADLLDAIAGLKQGAVLLPGLDQNLNEEAWQAITPSHPQYNLKKLLEKFDIQRADVKLWNSARSERDDRVRLLQAAMLPAAVTEQWRHLTPQILPKTAASHLSCIEADHPQEEAQVIALMLRKILDEPAKTAALVTPDRDLAERVCSMLTRWGIVANDSAGSPLTMQPVGSYLQDILMAARPGTTAVDYLSLLKHPLTAMGMDPILCREQARQVELQVWRNETPEQSDWLRELQKKLQALTSRWHQKLPLTAWLKAHIELAEECAASGNEAGGDRLWLGDAGEAASEWLNDWQKAAAAFPPVTGDDYAGLFAHFMRAVTIRPSFCQHTRLSILGAIEARLLQADLVILGGMNEGTWPPEAPIDPWMSRPMKQDFGLPSPERLIGLSAHDFVQLASAPEVVLTRSNRAGSAPTVPSRFLLQLETVLQAVGYIKDDTHILQPQEPWLDYARLLDAEAAPRPCDPPQPKPPLGVRPRQLSVTEIGTWRRNPYAIYAKHILHVRKLESLDAEIDAADRGSLIHDALEQFIKQHPSILPPNALDELLAIGRKVFAVYKQHPEVTAFWWPRFERIAAWFVDHEADRRAAGVKLLQAEADGAITFAQNFTLKGRADRIDQRPDGTIAIVDYKTGSVPSPKEIQAGFEPQLALLAFMAAQGGFSNLPKKAASELAYWKLSGNRKAAEEKPVSGDIAALVEEAAAGLEKLIAIFADANTPYQAVPKPQYQPRYDDYAHLARLSEWGRVAGEGDE